MPIRNLIVVLLLVMLSLTPSQTLIAQDCEPDETVHVVANGEALFNIGVQYGISYQTIASRNEIDDVAFIVEGQTLCIPAGSTFRASNPTNTTSSTTETTTVATTTTAATNGITGNENWCASGQPWDDGRCIVPDDPSQQSYLFFAGWCNAQVDIGNYIGSVDDCLSGKSGLIVDPNAAPTTTVTTVIENNPVDEGTIAPAEAPTTNTATIAVNLDGLTGGEATLGGQLANYPIVPAISGRAVAIYNRAIAAGRNPQHFIQIGDSNSASQAYLGLIGQGNYSLGSYGYLQSTISYFMGGGINSFTEKQQTAQSGNFTTTIIDPIFGNPNFCPGKSMLDCEIDRTNPSIAIIYLGAADRQSLGHGAYYNALLLIVDKLVANDILPILTLMPTKPHPQRAELTGMEFNMIMLDIAGQYGIPVINMWAAVRNLPEYGMENDLLHFTYSGTPFLNFAGEENEWGYTRWNLEVLKTLTALRRAAGV